MNSLALDIGGANLKAAWRGGVVSVRFPLWRQHRQLSRELHAVAARCPSFDRLAVTMTGELCDCFASRGDGVRHILSAVEDLASGRPVAVWSHEGRFMTVAQAVAQPERVAAANWHAQATWVARRYPLNHQLLIDTGSTTTDLIPLHDGQVAAKGMTDTERLATGELLYLGGRRTPLMALGTRLHWNGRLHGVMAEQFATMADIGVLVGAIREDAHDRDTADGRPLTCDAAARRVLRMVGADYDQANIDEAVELAYAFLDLASHRIISALEPLWIARVILSGSGAWLPLHALRRSMPLVDPLDLSSEISEAASTAACAVAMLDLVVDPSLVTR
ncbi:MAG: H4MPT-linked C1 transfer pathway protein [Phycisphaeraceae bacterium]|nr:H4MPT-linked C1 transfer pathway protein [Phycisphaeraceae bacterium]